MKNKRVIQISLDIAVDCECDGTELADNVAYELERRGYKILGEGFQDDVTDAYAEYYPELFKE